MASSITASACKGLALRGQQRHVNRVLGTLAAVTSPRSTVFKPHHSVSSSRFATVRSSTTGTPGAYGKVYDLRLRVDGMVCGGCSSRVEEALLGVPGVMGVDVSLEKALAYVQVDSSLQPLPERIVSVMTEKIKDLGFDAALD